MFKKIKVFLFCILFSGGAFAALPVTNSSNVNVGGAAVSSSNPLPTGVYSGTTPIGICYNAAGLVALCVSDPGIIKGPTVASTTTDGINVIAVPYLIRAILIGQVTTASATIIGTPPGNSYCRQLEVEIPANATQAVAGDDLITIALNGVTIATLDPYIPSTASSTVGFLIQSKRDFTQIAPNTYLTGGTLTVTLATALTAGAVNINAYFD